MDIKIYLRKIGSVIKTERVNHGHTQPQLAELIGVSIRQLIYYEKGQTDINVSTLLKISNVLDIDITELLPTKTTPLLNKVVIVTKGAKRGRPSRNN